jgi:hypothetical protein
MAEGRNPRAPSKSSGTMRIKTIDRERPLLKSAGLVLVVALAGAAIGSLGSQLLARFAVKKGAAETTKPTVHLLRSESHEGRLAEIDEALTGQDSATAFLLCEEALRQNPSEAQLLARRKRAEEMQLDRFRLDMLEQALSRRNFAAAQALLEEFSLASPLRATGAFKMEQAAPQFVEETLSEAERAMQLSLCGEARLLAVQVQKLKPHDEKATQILSQCVSSD